jgi:hypothetical protein
MDKTADRLAVPKRLTSVEPGTRVRLFHMEMGMPVATSGTLVSVAGGEVHVAQNDGAEVKVLLATVTRFYVPPPVPPAVRPTAADMAGFVARARAAIVGLRRPTQEPLGHPQEPTSFLAPAAGRHRVEEIELPPAPARRPGPRGRTRDRMGTPHT